MAKQYDEAMQRQISFDLDTKQLEIYYPKKHWQSAYDDIKGFINKKEKQEGKRCIER